MQKAPKDKMVKTSPRKKEVTNQQGEVEILGEDVKPETTEELSNKEKKEIVVIKQQIQEGVALQKYTRPQIELLKRTVAKDATDDELMLFLTVSSNSKLDPFTHQVHFVKRWDSKEGRDVGTIQVGIDGFRAIAESGGQYAGSDDAVFRDEEEKKLKMGKAEVTKKVPGIASVTVYKLIGDKRYPFSATARWDEFYPGEKQGYMWAKMPYNQLSKCAEALALRKAFPKLLSGLYEPSEMDQAMTLKKDEVNAFDRAIKMIKLATDVVGLKNIKDKIAASNKYDDDQKAKLQAAIDNRVAELEQTNVNA